MRKHLSTAVFVACLAAVPLMGWTAASAASAASARPLAATCPSSGHITNWDVCTTLSNGVLRLDMTENGDLVDVTYHKNSGSATTGELGYVRSGSSHLSPTLTLSTSLEASYRWTPAASCASTTGQLVSGSDVFTTPAAVGC